MCFLSMGVKNDGNFLNAKMYIHLDIMCVLKKYTSGACFIS
jgi:hypothetical protein